MYYHASDNLSSFIINYRHILLNKPHVIFSLDKLIIFWTHEDFYLKKPKSANEQSSM